MPYAPGITDISGQLRAQGRIAGARALGQGIGDFGKDIAEGMRAYQQNQMMASQATAKADAIFQQNPDILQFLTSEAAPSDLAKLYSKRQKDGTLPLKDAATLAQYAETAMGQKKQAQAAALQKMQMGQIMQEMAMKKAQIDQQVKAQAAMAAAFAPQPPITEYGQAINSGVRFEDLGGGQISPAQNRVISRGGTPTIGEGMVSMARAGVSPPPNMTQFLNTAADYEATQGSIAQRALAAETREAAAKAESSHKTRLAEIAKEKLDIAKHPLIAAIDASVEAKEITPEEAKQYKKEIFKKGGEFSPNGFAAIASLLGLGESTAVGATIKEPETPDALVAAVREKRMTLEQAKQLAAKKGWK